MVGATSPMLPVELLSGGLDWTPGESVRLQAELPATPHPIWTLMADAKQNRQIVGSLPAVSGLNRWVGARTNLTTVLATAAVSGTPTANAAGDAALLVAGAEAGRIRPGNLENALSASDPPVAATGASPGHNAGVRNEVLLGQALPQPPGAPSAGSVPAVVVGRYGRGRTAALAFAVTAPYADELVQRWGLGDNRYYAKFCRNLIYWLTENSAIGRRRLVASADKRFYRPGETIAISAATYDESASPTKNYRVVAMVEPHTAPGEAEPETSPLRWPSGMPRTSGEEEPFVVWGEEFELPLGGQNAMSHAIQLPLAEVLSSGTSSQSLRVELTAYEDLTQIDSTSLDVQVLHDPFEQQNPFPNHELLARLAAGSGGKVLRSAEDLAELLRAVPTDVGPPIVRRVPLWSNVWVWGLLIGLLTVEWCWRRTLGLA
ncbi:MAG: hypothetical protein B7Z73_15755 [Planctomycetia bacterium 21-64-5]|nr:MAG: hypothetical protein B7Z73_15755 [Planctomycetia bacterium 21-64-5]